MKFTKGRKDRIVPITLTYALLEEPIVFKLREETAAARKVRSAAEAQLTGAEKKTTEFQRNAQFIADQIAEEPQGLGDFPTVPKELPEGVQPRSLRERVLDYFSDPEDEDLVTLCNHIVNRYWRLITPLEFFL